MIALNVMTIVLDVLWILTMRSIWSGKPTKNATQWKAFNNVRGVTIFLSFVNVAIKGFAVFMLGMIKSAHNQTMSKNVKTGF